MSLNNNSLSKHDLDLINKAKKDGIIDKEYLSFFFSQLKFVEVNSFKLESSRFDLSYKILGNSKQMGFTIGNLEEGDEKWEHKNRLFGELMDEIIKDIPNY